MKIEKLTLATTRVRLEPLCQDHYLGLIAALKDGALWESPVTTFPHPEDLAHYMEAAELGFQHYTELAFATIDVASETIVGSTRFRNINVQHKRAEIGSTFIAKSWQRTHINTEAKYLMLHHAFETWGVNRVELLTNTLNDASRNAIIRLGAKEEGVLRNYRVMHDGSSRDSVIFSIIGSEWPLVKSNLEAKIIV